MTLDIQYKTAKFRLSVRHCTALLVTPYKSNQATAQGTQQVQSVVHTVYTVNHVRGLSEPDKYLSSNTSSKRLFNESPGRTIVILFTFREFFLNAAKQPFKEEPPESKQLKDVLDDMENELSDDSDSFLRSQATFILGLLGPVKLGTQAKTVLSTLQECFFQNCHLISSPHQDFAAFQGIGMEEVNYSIVLLELNFNLSLTSFFSIKSTFFFWHRSCFRLGGHKRNV